MNRGSPETTTCPAALGRTLHGSRSVSHGGDCPAACASPLPSGFAALPQPSDRPEGQTTQLAIARQRRKVLRLLWRESDHALVDAPDECWGTVRRRRPAMFCDCSASRCS